MDRSWNLGFSLAEPDHELDNELDKFKRQRQRSAVLPAVMNAK